MWRQYTPREAAPGRYDEYGYTPSMPTSINFRLTHPHLPPGRIEGFRYIWAYYVSGYDPRKHCQPGLRGSRVPDFCTTTARSGVLVSLDEMDRYPYVYLCGVGSGPRRELAGKNLHLPMRHREGATVSVTTYNGYEVVAHDAERVFVPALPDDFNGLPREHARCKNFQFAVAVFGWPPGS